jgi:hypothetical protein
MDRVCAPAVLRLRIPLLATRTSTKRASQQPDTDTLSGPPRNISLHLFARAASGRQFFRSHGFQLAEFHPSNAAVCFHSHETIDVSAKHR